MNYDNWLVQQEHDARGWNTPEHECMHCGTPVDKKGSYCSMNCFDADML